MWLNAEQQLNVNRLSLRVAEQPLNVNYIGRWMKLTNMKRKYSGGAAKKFAENPVDQMSFDGSGKLLYEAEIR
jgi:hypothetical protein